MPAVCRTREEFVDEVAEWLSDTRPVDPEKAVNAVFRTLSRHISQGQVDHVKQALPKGLRQMWDEAEAIVVEATVLEVTPVI
ncbi:DUF2267 domain-containing protein [Sphingomonas sediminicola]|nr:DUF2267 domain-containing protein [Sphingomonas sediminicola]